MNIETSLELIYVVSSVLRENKMITVCIKLYNYLTKREMHTIIYFQIIFLIID